MVAQILLKKEEAKFDVNVLILMKSVNFQLKIIK